MIGILPPVLNSEKETVSRLLVGSSVASREFARSMLRFLPADSVGLFVHESGLAMVRRDLARLEENEGGNYRTARVWSTRDFSTILKTESFTAFHNTEAPVLHQLSYLRSQFATRPFPITCLTHGLSQQNLLWDFFTRLLLTPTLPCDSVICTSNAVRDALQNILEQIREGLQQIGFSNAKEKHLRLDVIPLGVDVELFRPRDKADARRLLGLPLNKTILLYFGRIDPSTKGDLGPLLFTFRELLTKYGENLVLVLTGTAAEHGMSYLQRLVQMLGCANQVLVRLQPSLMESPLYYAAADVFVSPVETLQESFGLTPLEAMASGLPVVVSDWSGYKETVVHGQTGFRVRTLWANCDEDISLFAPLRPWEGDHLRLSQSVALDKSELFQYLDTLIANPEQRALMGQAARKHVLMNLSWESVIARCYMLWQELAQIANALPQEKIVHPHLETPQYFKNFSHFASQCLDGSEHLEITDRGHYACGHPDIIFLHPEMQSVLHFKVLLIILRFIRAKTSSKQRATVREVCDKIAPHYPLTPQTVLAHIMWLVKYGLLHVTNA